LRYIPFLFVIVAAGGCCFGPDALSTAPPDAEWSKLSNDGEQPLANVPAVSSPKSRGNEICVTVTNNGDTTLTYYSGGSKHVQLFQECEQNGEWQMGNWDWCGTGKEYFELAPGQSADLVVEVWDTGKRERMLAHFIEKGTPRSGMVVLYSEPR
jgi:hypothetical protein